MHIKLNAIIYFLIILVMQGTANYTASIFTGEEEIFAFERSVSRLVEMQGDEYLNSEWTISSKDENNS